MFQEVVITASVCAVIAVSVFYEHRVQTIQSSVEKQVSTLLDIAESSNNERKWKTLDRKMEYLEEVLMGVKQKVENSRSLSGRNGDNLEGEEDENMLDTHHSVAFSVSLSHALYDEEAVSEVVIYDVVTINVGEGYDSSTGIFTCPQNGLYGFHWTSLTLPGKWYQTELNVNGEQQRLNSCNNKGNNSSGILTCSAMVVAEMKVGDIAWVAKFGMEGDYLMEMYSSFTGWKL